MTVLPGHSPESLTHISDPGMARQDPHLQSRYEEYRRRQARELVSILPREAIRPIYARAREWGRTRGVRVEKDPLATLVLFLAHLLPLPPFHVWLNDRLANLEAHLREEFESPQARSRTTAPVTVESRRMEMEGRHWRAALHLFLGHEVWRGFITFHPVEGGEVLRTADIFREEDPEEIRTRFRGYQNHTLQAFLRSVFPG